MLSSIRPQPASISPPNSLLGAKPLNGGALSRDVTLANGVHYAEIGEAMAPLPPALWEPVDDNFPPGMFVTDDLLKRIAADGLAPSRPGL